ncbi:hypothetical protein CRG98_046242, partial [Punica granatum]
VGSGGGEEQEEHKPREAEPKDEADEAAEAVERQPEHRCRGLHPAIRGGIHGRPAEAVAPAVQVALDTVRWFQLARDGFIQRRKVTVYGNLCVSGAPARRSGGRWGVAVGGAFWGYEGHVAGEWNWSTGGCVGRTGI